MSKSKLKDFQSKAVSTAGRTVQMHGFIDTAVMNALGLAGESGEVVDTIKKVAYHSKPMSPELRVKLLYELGDIMWYIANLAEALNSNLDEVCDMVIAKLKERYPDGFNEQRAEHRDTSKVYNTPETPPTRPTFNRAAAEKAAGSVLDSPEMGSFNARGF